MNKATGPTHSLTLVQPGVEGVNFVQEELVMVGDEYALLGYTPSDPRSVMVFVDRVFYMQGESATATTFVMDGRKLQFSEALSGGEVVVATYNTIDVVAAIPAVEIEFDIPGRDIRVSSAGSLQVLVSNGEVAPETETFSWHDMLPQVHPITGGITYDVVEAISPNQ